MRRAVSGKFIITGGPGSGKTTLLDRLREDGFHCYSEVSRRLIREQASLPDGVLPWHNLPLFAALVLDAMKAQYDHAAAVGTTCFFDCGIPDVFAYLETGGYPVPKRYLDVHAACAYDCRVFILPPWPEIFVNDSERPQSYPESVALYRSIYRVYSRLGYILCEVPKITVRERAAFLRLFTV